MAAAEITAEFKSGVEKVWAVVTDLKDFTWRSDLSEIIIKDEKNFTEVTKDGYKTDFTITAYEPLKRYEFDMENGNMSGHWTGIFEKTDSGCKITFTEDVKAKKLFMKPFAGAYLRKQQVKYVKDLASALGE